jgi:hypothetical protein
MSQALYLQHLQSPTRICTIIVQIGGLSHLE